MSGETACQENRYYDRVGGLGTVAVKVKVKVRSDDTTYKNP
jgi:hypothetical protein